MATVKHTKVRRQTVRRRLAESEVPLMERLRGHVGLWPVAATIVFIAAAIWISLFGTMGLPYSAGQKIHQPILARVDFAVPNEGQTEKNRQLAREGAPNHYRTNQTLIDGIAESLQTVYQQAKAAETLEEFAPKAKELGIVGDEPLYSALIGLADEQGGEKYARWVENLRKLLRERYTHDPKQSASRQLPASSPTFRLVSEDSAEAPSQPATVRSVEDTLLDPITSTERMRRLADELALKAGFAPLALQDAIRNMLATRLQAEPLLLFDQAATEQAIREAAESVPMETIAFKAGQSIVSPKQGGGDLVLTTEHLALLEAEQAQYETLLAGNAPQARPLREQLYWQQAGAATIILVLSLGLFAHIQLHQPRIFAVRSRTIAIYLLFLAMFLAGRVLEVRFGSRELILLPAMIAAACLTIAYPYRFAGGLIALGALMMVVTVRGDIGLFMTMLIGLVATTFLLRDIRTRTQIITSGLVISAIVFLVAFAFGLIDRQSPSYAVLSGGWAAGSAFAAALVVQGVLPFIERAFRIATSLTLLEWSAADRPLLVRLAREAAGTYNHSLVLSTIGPAACEAIGANGLLLRVGALYHDVGKILKAEYFAENQESSINRHDKLAASMSLLIILGHVKDGVELAKEYGLPRVLIPFIEEHHGTTVVKYFHHKASEQQPLIASGKHDREVSESEFRYPGPKPQSKETAILMICDGIEGAVRALPEPTAARIEAVVHRIITERLNDGQFGDCDITLKELQIVEETLVKGLCTFYHGRVSYPKSGAEKGAVSELSKQRKRA